MMANLIQERPGARILAEIRTLLALRVSPQEIGVLFRTLAQLPALKEEADRWALRVHAPPRTSDSTIPSRSPSRLPAPSHS